MVHKYGFAGLSALGWTGFMLLWVLQAVVFWRGMEMIKKFIDIRGSGGLRGHVHPGRLQWCGRAGWRNIGLNLGVR